MKVKIGRYIRLPHLVQQPLIYIRCTSNGSHSFQMKHNRFTSLTLYRSFFFCFFVYHLLLRTNAPFRLHLCHFSLVHCNRFSAVDHIHILHGIAVWLVHMHLRFSVKCRFAIPYVISMLLFLHSLEISISQRKFAKEWVVVHTNILRLRRLLTVIALCFTFITFCRVLCFFFLFFLSSRMLYMHDAMMAAAITCLTVIRYRALGCAQALEDWRVPYRIGDIWLKWKSINEMTCQNRSPARYSAIVKHSMAINVDINIFSCSIRFRHALDEMVHVRLPVILLYLYLVWVNICGSGKIIMYLFLYLFIGIVQWLLLLTVCVCVGTLLIKPFRFSLHLKQMNGFAWYKR